MKYFLVFITGIFSVTAWTQRVPTPFRDSTGKHAFTATDFVYDEAFPFNRANYTIVKQGAKWFIIDEDFYEISSRVDSIDIDFFKRFNGKYIELLKSGNEWYLFNCNKGDSSESFLSVNNDYQIFSKLLVNLPNRKLALLDINRLKHSIPFDAFLIDPNTYYSSYWVKENSLIHKLDQKGNLSETFECVEPDFLEINYYAYKKNGTWKINGSYNKEIEDSNYFGLPWRGIAFFRKKNTIYFSSYDQKTIKIRPGKTIKSEIWNIDKRYNDQYRNVDTNYILFKREKYGFMDTHLHIVLAPKYDSAYAFGHSHTAVKLGNEWGIINKQGAFTVSPTYQILIPTKEPNFFIACKDGKYGVISAEGKIIQAFTYIKLFECTYGILATKDEKVGMIDYALQVQIPFEYTQISDLGSGWLVFEKSGLKGVYDYSEHKELFIGEYKGSFTRLASMYIYHKTDSIKQLISESGQVLLSGKYAEINYLNGGYFAIRYGNEEYYAGSTYEIYNAKERKMLPGKYEYVGKLSNGLFPVSNGKKYGFVDTQGQLVIPYIYSYVSLFNDNKAKVWKGGGSFYIDTNGQKVKN